MSLAIERALADWRECRAEFELELYARYVRAEAETHGALLNARGRARGIDPISLMFGPAARAHAYASDELVEHWASHPRLTFAAFEQAWIAQRDHEQTPPWDDTPSGLNGWPTIGDDRLDDTPLTAASDREDTA